MSEALFGFLHHTLSSNLDQESKQCHINICRNAMDAASLYITWPSYRRLLYEDWTGLLNSVEFGHFLRAAKYSNSLAEYYSDHLIAATIATVQGHNDRWFELAASQLRISRADLEYYLTYGDSVSLANCIDICRRTMQSYSENDWVIPWRWKCLEITSDFAARNTLPGLQHEFCGLWNELTRMTGDSTDRRMRELATCILRHIRTDSVPTVFSASTDNYANVLFYPSSYPSCNIPEHDSRISETTTGPTEDAPHPPAPTSTPTVTPTALVVPSSPGPHSSHSTARPAYGMSSGDILDAPQPTTASSRPTRERLESHKGLAISLDVAARGITQGTTDLPATSSTTSSDPVSTPAASSPIPPQVFAPPSSGTVALPVVPDMSPSSPPNTVPSYTSPADLDPTASQFDETPSTIAISFVSPQVDPYVADTDVPTPVEAPHDPLQTARSGPDLATDVSLGAAPSL
ncbi:hypothetical protein BJV78DRAFT_1223194, partial [Lactifluus subvellereus]